MIYYVKLAVMVLSLGKEIYRLFAKKKDPQNCEIIKEGIKNARAARLNGGSVKTVCSLDYEDK